MSLHHILTLSYLIMALLVAFVFFVTQFVVYALHSDFTWLRRVVIKQPKIHMRMRRLWKISTCRFVNNYSEKCRPTFQYLFQTSRELDQGYASRRQGNRNLEEGGSEMTRSRPFRPLPVAIRPQWLIGSTSSMEFPITVLY